MLEVIAAVKKASGTDFKVTLAPRRAGDPAALVASADRVRDVLGWQPELADLDTIVAHAYAWEARIGKLAKAS